ncbi:MAG TPA: ThuA domain-containing protein [Mycobacteriales bacterium]|nr:ThuA domain-containing protein [Mycobacteriales bacterium]
MGSPPNLSRRHRAVLHRLAVMATAAAVALIGLPAVAAVAAPGSATDTAGAGSAAVRVLVFSGTADATNPTVPAAVGTLADLGRHNGFAVDATTDAAAFTAANLARYRAVVFLAATGDVLSTDQEAAFQAYVAGGGGFLGVHDAALAQPASTWFTGLIGSRPAATSPSAAQTAVVEVPDRVHPATKNLPLTLTRSDLWTNWSPNPVGTVHTVASVRELSYTAGTGANGPYHPISWCRDYTGGRSFYTGMGGTAASYQEKDFRAHLLGGLEWAAGLVRGDCQATITANYKATRLTQPNQTGQLDQIGEPHGLTITKDGRVFYIGRGGPMTGGPAPITDWNDPNIGLGRGTIHLWDPKTGAVKMVADLPVFGNRGAGPESNKTEEGLVGITLDPKFDQNHWLYVFWMPYRTVDRVNHVGKRTISRFTFDPATGTVDVASEKVLLDWATQIDRCCHVGGGMVFDPQGNLYVSSGDNNSSQCDGCGASANSGYSGNNPVPEFGGFSQQDARRTAGNTNDLNGKILRIHPQPNGTYTVPRGNLFTGREEGGGKTRPEVYAMGVRNPTRLAFDPKNGWLLAGWVGPDAGAPSLTWGPAKYETAVVITKPGNFGWPYCMGNKQPYRDRNLPDITQPLGWYDCDHPRNDSPRNTGLVNLPPVQSNNIWYSPQGGGPVFERGADGIPIYDTAHQTLTEPYLPGGGGQAIMPGPMYRYDAKNPSTTKFPAYWDGKWFIGDESRSATRVALTMDPKTAASGSAPAHADDIRQIVPSSSVGALMDWKFGPDGALYVLDYGTGFFNATARSALWRIDYTGGPATPAPTATATPAAGEPPLTVGFTGSRSGGVSYRWNFGDGATSTQANPTHTYRFGGDFTARLTVRYADGSSGTATTTVSVTCAAPDARPTVRFLDLDTGVPNKATAGGCTINDLIADEQPWSSSLGFVAHVTDVAAHLSVARTITGGQALQLIAAAVRSRIGTPNGPKPYTSIFDGTAGSLNQWAQAPSGSFSLQPGGTIRSTGGLGMLWYTGAQFGDFSVRLQFKDDRTDGGSANSGVFVRFPDPRTPLADRPAGSCGTVGSARTQQAWVAIYCGQEVQIYDGATGEPQKTGSIYNFAPTDLAHSGATPAGVWNDYEIRVVGQHYTIIRNGVVINEFDNTPGKTSSRAGDPPTDLRQFASGFLGLQNHSNADVIEFRNIRVRPLTG